MHCQQAFPNLAFCTIQPSVSSFFICIFMYNKVHIAVYYHKNHTISSLLCIIFILLQTIVRLILPFLGDFPSRATRLSILHKNSNKHRYIASFSEISLRRISWAIWQHFQMPNQSKHRHCWMKADFFINCFFRKQAISTFNFQIMLLLKSLLL